MLFYEESRAREGGAALLLSLSLLLLKAKK